MIDSIKQFKKSIKYFSAIIGVLLMFVSFFGIFFSPLDPKGFILYFYTFIFGILIVSSEFGYLMKYFGFMNFNFGRGIFEIFVGLSILIFDWNSNIFAKIVAIFTLLVGVGQIVVSCIPSGNIEEELPDEEEELGVIVVNNKPILYKDLDPEINDLDLR